MMSMSAMFVNMFAAKVTSQVSENEARYIFRQDVANLRWCRLLITTCCKWRHRWLPARSESNV